ncbi:hypothetical protein H0H87_005431 [Tephrocybe sp. NHM501043]|nr:hypothetical protein H0H87_005431 [Tephrocybe sp. NHM501043]
MQDARGDQCDGCSRTLDAIELIKPRCLVDKTHVVTTKSSAHMYLRLDEIQPRTEEWIKQSWKAGKWSPNAVINADGVIIDPRLKGGLIPTPLTRDLTWGVPIPAEFETEEQGMKGKFDAPIGYPSITANYTPEWRQWWFNPKDVHLYQFMGKDNVYFHTVYWPSVQLGDGFYFAAKTHTSSSVPQLPGLPFEHNANPKNPAAIDTDAPGWTVLPNDTPEDKVGVTSPDRRSLSSESVIPVTVEAFLRTNAQRIHVKKYGRRFRNRRIIQSSSSSPPDHECIDQLDEDNDSRTFQTRLLLHNPEHCGPTRTVENFAQELGRPTLRFLPVKTLDNSGRTKPRPIRLWKTTKSDKGVPFRTSSFSDPREAKVLGSEPKKHPLNTWSSFGNSPHQNITSSKRSNMTHLPHRSGTISSCSWAIASGDYCYPSCPSRRVQAPTAPAPINRVHYDGGDRSEDPLLYPLDGPTEPEFPPYVPPAFDINAALLLYTQAANSGIPIGSS